MGKLKTQALRCGVGVFDFYAMTPGETLEVIDAYLYRNEQQYKRGATMAWLNARLSRAKKIPTLKTLLKPDKPKKTSAKEVAQAKQDFTNAPKSLDISKIGKIKNG